MMVARLLALFAVIACCLAPLDPVQAQEPLRQEDTFLRIKVDRRDVRLEALIVRPETEQGRLPLALITHGKSSSSISMGDLRASSYATVARDFARRGWLAAVVMRRGFGQSDGPFPGSSSCEKLDLGQRFNTDADELEGALKALQLRDDVDPERAIAIGESAGGAAVLALAQRKPAGLRGVVNVAGGLNIENCVDKGQNALVDVVKTWQKPGAPPQLWIYARNDELFPPSLVDRMRAAALDGGGDVRFVDLAEIKPKGHLIFRHGQARFVWLREMDASLRAWKLPTWSPQRARELYAKLGLTTRAESFERYFAAPGEKAMALSPGRKQFHYWFGTTSLDRAKENALRDCAKTATDCVVAFENDRSVLPD
ncbi:MAG TPA: alpha/beta hydrolase [Bosea sp. (in: a-proteobacteria)]|jgi:pimeloyl-ACP methyl ester carboxylesterase|uniref:alpha/beta hydrolase family protein n=1 Tax=Bosea sp. (in: a-proteobacteria) TaxID=1871050 RepID=UPI002E10B8A7|nr:alpha/beta hydrolase [Bosea sp. (in: a-proteobacteria)]